MATDPGWQPALATFWRYILFPTWQQRSPRVQRMPLLIWIRSMTLAAPAMWVVFLVVLLLARKPSSVHTNGRTWAIAVAATGVVSIVLIVIARSRPPRAKDAVSIASLYRARYFLGWSLCTTPVLLAFVAYFQTSGEITIFLIGALLGLVGDVVNAPTHVRLQAEQTRLTQAQSGVMLLDALMLPNGQIPQRPRR